MDECLDVGKIQCYNVTELLHRELWAEGIDQMKKLFNHTKRPDRNWEEDVQDGYDWDEEEYTGEEDSEEYYADEEEYPEETDGEEYYADEEEHTGEDDGEEY